MFIRKKKNNSGVISIQILRKYQGKNKLIEAVGSSANAEEVERFYRQAKERIRVLTQQSIFNFEIEKEQALSDMFFTGLNEICLMGPRTPVGQIV